MATSVIKVVAIDPGITTGYAVGLIEQGEMGVISGQTVWNELALWTELNRSTPDVLIYETFEFRNQPSRQKLNRIELFSRNLIGVMNLYAQQTKCVLRQQTPFTGKQYYTDNHLKKDKLYKPLKGGHANDAVRHLLQWFTFGPGYKHNEKGYRPLA